MTMIMSITRTLKARQNSRCRALVISLLYGSQTEVNTPHKADSTEEDDTLLDRNEGKVDNGCQRPNLVAGNDDGEKFLHEYCSSRRQNEYCQTDCIHPKNRRITAVKDRRDLPCEELSLSPPASDF